MPSNSIFCWDLGALGMLGPNDIVSLTVLNPTTHIFSDPGDHYINGPLDFDERVDGDHSTTLVLEATITLTYSVGGASIGPVDISGHYVVATRVLPLPSTIVTFVPAHPDLLDSNLINGTFTIGVANLSLGLGTSFKICFAGGTAIQTGGGRTLVEDLRVGDMVQTLDNGLQPIRWIHSSTVWADGDLAPIRIAEGVLGNDCDLVVSPQHRMLLRDWRAELLFSEPEVLVTAKSLINGKSIRKAFGGFVTYYHFLCDQHEIVFANGAPTESFLPGQMGIGTLEQEIQAEIYTLFPDLETNLDSYGAAARMPLKNYEGQAMARLGVH